MKTFTVEISRKDDIIKLTGRPLNKEGAVNKLKFNYEFKPAEANRQPKPRLATLRGCSIFHATPPCKFVRPAFADPLLYIIDNTIRKQNYPMWRVSAFTRPLRGKRAQRARHEAHQRRAYAISSMDAA
jgi:hypothetical protein